jgi:alpha-glucuronidase
MNGLSSLAVIMILFCSLPMPGQAQSLVPGNIASFQRSMLSHCLESKSNWTGNTFGQSNWYAFGRLSWDHSLTSGQIADEWIRMTFSKDTSIINPIKKIMMASRENVVDYRDPLGLNM